MYLYGNDTQFFVEILLHIIIKYSQGNDWNNYTNSKGKYNLYYNICNNCVCSVYMGMITHFTFNRNLIMICFFNYSRL